MIYQPLYVHVYYNTENMKSLNAKRDLHHFTVLRKIK